MSENISSPSSNPTNKIRNIVIAVIAIVLGVFLVLGSQTTLNDQSLEAQAEHSTALNVATTNGKPTLLEFYANWCTSCQAMAGDLAQLKQDYQGQVNFVMLNVDNSKWLPEVLDYNVDGIPHFIFLNNQGDAIAESIGEQPLAIMDKNLQALTDDRPIPYAFAKGNISDFNAQQEIKQGNQDDPRAHGASS